MRSCFLALLAIWVLLAAGAANAQQQCPPGMYCPPSSGGFLDPSNGGQQIPQQQGTPTITNRGAQVPQAPAGAPRPFYPGAQGTMQPLAPGETFRFLPQFTPPEPPNEFQEFLYASTGRILPLFGRSLFENVPSTFAPVENVPVTPDYAIGPGDELYIRAWGSVDIDYRVTVDRNGAIAIPRIGVVNVAGVRYQDLTAYIKNAVSRVFRGFDLTVTMGQLRAVQVFVVGQARRPGSYTVGSLSTLVNTIFAAGGPSNRGSMRSVQLRR